ncbi:GL22232 [Drosophila persimilis]|uniref:GL22232 n=1 Tax=Drosophila persimilis TaxID=7234 RepID=B4HD63_DROPE|nr:GL22232 [Drosophila persimilis]
MIVGPAKAGLFRNARNFTPSIVINGSVQVQVKDSLRYLGVVFDHKHNFHKHLDLVLGKAKRQMAIVSRYFGLISSSNTGASSSSSSSSSLSALDNNNNEKITKIRSLIYKKLIQPLLLIGIGGVIVTAVVAAAVHSGGGGCVGIGSGVDVDDHFKYRDTSGSGSDTSGSGSDTSGSGSDTSGSSTSGRTN